MIACEMSRLTKRTTGASSETSTNDSSWVSSVVASPEERSESSVSTRYSWLIRFRISVRPARTNRTGLEASRLMSSLRSRSLIRFSGTATWSSSPTQPNGITLARLAKSAGRTFAAVGSTRCSVRSTNSTPAISAAILSRS